MQEYTREQLITRTRKIKSEIEQIFIDAAHWNENVRKPRQVPIDPDPDGKLALILEGLNKTLKTEEGRRLNGGI